MRRIGAAIFGLMAVLGLLGAEAARAAPACALPADVALPHSEGPTQREPTRVLPIGGYTLAIVWMPQTCRADPQADGCGIWRASRRGMRNPGSAAERSKADFTLHGLWPDGRGKDWPQYCRAAAVLPEATLRAHLCATPSAQLLQHEWTKHGTCMAGYTPDRYFDLSNRLSADLRAPNLWALSHRRQTAASVARAFAAANPPMTADMMRLNLDRKGWLEEVWLCLDTRFRPQRCPATQGGARGDAPVLIWRGGGGDRGKGRHGGRTERGSRYR